MAPESRGAVVPADGVSNLGDRVGRPARTIAGSAAEAPMPPLLRRLSVQPLPGLARDERLDHFRRPTRGELGT